MRSVFIYAAAAWSGFFIMCLELLGGRLLAPYFGSSVWGGIITVFMLLLSVGYLLGGKLSTKAKPQLTILGVLILSEAILATPIILFGDSTLEWLSYVCPDPRYGSMLGAFILFGMSTVCSGMISPYAVRLLVSDVHKAGSSAGTLYFCSTIGSAAGTLITSFYLILLFEIFDIIKYAMMVSCTLGILLLLYRKNPLEHTLYKPTVKTN